MLRGRPPSFCCFAVAVALVGCREAAARDEATSLSPPPAVSAALPEPSPPVAPAPGGTAASASAAPSAPAKGHGEARYALDFDDADLPELVRIFGAITGKRFVYSGRMPVLHASVHAPDKVTAAEAYQAFLAILQANGLTVVVRGRFHVIVPSPGVPSD